MFSTRILQSSIFASDNHLFVTAYQLLVIRLPIFFWSNKVIGRKAVHKTLGKFAKSDTYGRDVCVRKAYQRVINLHLRRLSNLKGYF